VIAVVVIVEIAEILVFDEGALDLFGRLVAIGNFTPSERRRMSIWVVGVPLPGKKLSAVRTT